MIGICEVSDFPCCLDIEEENENMQPAALYFSFTRLCCLVLIVIVCGLPVPVMAADPLPLNQVQYWAYQIQKLDTADAVNKLAASRYDMLVVDPTVTTDLDFKAGEMVRKLKESMAYDGVHRKLVIAYIDIGQAEEWRWYWHGHPVFEESGRPCSEIIPEIQTWASWVVACDPDGWAGNYPVAFWDTDWQDIVIHGTALGSDIEGIYFDSMLDEVIQDGFDGVYLDWVEGWEMTEVQDRAMLEGKDAGVEMLKFIRAIKAYGRSFNPSFIVIQQNSSELINEVGAPQLQGSVDAIAQEGVWWDGDAIDDEWDNENGFDQPSGNEDYYLPRLRKYKDAGFPVFVCEYAVVQASDAYRKAKNEGFVAYATRRPLSRLTGTPPFPASVVMSPVLMLLDNK